MVGIAKNNAPIIATRGNGTNDANIDISSPVNNTIAEICFFNIVSPFLATVLYHMSVLIGDRISRYLPVGF